MPNDYLDQGYACIYKSMEKGCLHCKSQRPCPPLIVIAMRYSPEVAGPASIRSKFEDRPTDVMFIT